MKTLVLIALAFTSSLFATSPAVQESPEHIAVSKDQIVVIEGGLFVAHDGQLFPASALFHTDTGFVAEVLREGIRADYNHYHRCPDCGQLKLLTCTNRKCPSFGK
ncbi:MAG: hypothetical protein JSR80_06420 [Verrucomicrobia bacterium]|nr:hypothetical protein [Verrucomicrobiota bacterium]